ncbi:RmlD-like substrate binding domain-containing protein [Myxozyma melibiosi]|uniref:RmlD-like substrate binding domain-containing protein n=1 Tax=Myxozyma melibiosi TaxID=54550 RepID=A0ABR1F7B0_9ASCO
MTSEPTRSCVVTGATGLLGRAILKRFVEYTPRWEAIGTGFTRASGDIVKLDLTDPDAVESLLQSTKPAIVVHSAAERRPDVAKERPDQVTLLNVAASEHVAGVTAALKIPMIYISTDYVFDGQNPPYEPEDKPNPTNFYGSSKLEGENAVLKKNPDAIVLRVPVLYGDTDDDSESAINCLVDIILNSKKDNVVEMDNWQLRYPTNTHDVARVVKDIADLAISKRTGPSILHFSADERFTKYEICEIFAELLDVPTTYLKRIDNVDDVQRSGTVTRPYDCRLSNKKLVELGIDVSAVEFREWWKRRLLPSRR